jgi:hypothetical protein
MRQNFKMSAGLSVALVKGKKTPSLGPRSSILARINYQSTVWRQYIPDLVSCRLRGHYSSALPGSGGHGQRLDAHTSPPSCRHLDPSTPPSEFPPLSPPQRSTSPSHSHLLHPEHPNSPTLELYLPLHPTSPAPPDSSTAFLASKPFFENISASPQLPLQQYPKYCG